MTAGSILGNMLGYNAGSFLYNIGGYTLPYCINSLGILILLPFLMLYLPSNEE